MPLLLTLHFGILPHLYRKAQLTIHALMLSTIRIISKFLFQFICSRLFLLLRLPVFSPQILFLRSDVFFCCNYIHKACTWCKNVNIFQFCKLGWFLRAIVKWFEQSLRWCVLLPLLSNHWPGVSWEDPGICEQGSCCIFYSVLLNVLCLFCFTENCLYNPIDTGIFHFWGGALGF